MFNSAQIDDPVGQLSRIIGFETQNLAVLKDQVDRNGDLALLFSKEVACA